LIITSISVPPAISLPQHEAERRHARQHARCDLADRHVGRACRRGNRKLIWRPPRPDIGSHAAVEDVPLNAKLTAGVTRRFDEAHLEIDLMWRRHHDRVDDIRRELARDRHGTVERDRIMDLARQHDTAVHRRYFDAAARDLGDLSGKPRDLIGHFDVEDADMPPVIRIDRDARGADLFAEHRNRPIGQRRHIRHLGITDRDVGEGRIDA
jgi:hypothetical protein